MLHSFCRLIFNEFMERFLSASRALWKLHGREMNPCNFLLQLEMSITFFIAFEMSFFGISIHIAYYAVVLYSYNDSISIFTHTHHPFYHLSQVSKASFEMSQMHFVDMFLMVLISPMLPMTPSHGIDLVPPNSRGSTILSS